MESLTFSNGISITWERGLDGGGSVQYLDFLNYLKENPKKYKHCLEWCAGLGAIGFSILDAGLCNQLSLSDLYEPAQTYALINAANNNITEKVKFYLGDSINCIPSDQKFDLVVANPPHCMLTVEESLQYDDICRRLITDIGWKIHKNFFDNITKYLLPGADVILSEIGVSEAHLTFAKDNNLQFIRHVSAPKLISSSNSNAVLMHYRYEI